ncbi:uncharacterized protein LOC141711536 [Apium graveolens]|uniref:uncharacterized protein LOC141711536 n=1 Tax=Apium graveolens TaxID=4045 RepID=UPI003D7AE7E3
MSITAYFTKMRSLTDELNALAPIPKYVCTQNSCTCGVTAKLEAYEQINSLSQFLIGLNDVFTGIRGQMLTMKPLPTLSQAYSLLLQEESQRASPIVSTVDSVAMNVKYAGKSKQFGQFSVKKSSESVAEHCDYYHNPGHNQEKCFFLHGYPDWHRLYGKPKPKLRPKKASQVTSQVTSQSAVTDGTDISGAESHNSPFPDAQCEQIAKMIQHSMKTFGNTWNNSPAHLSGSFSEADGRDW